MWKILIVDDDSANRKLIRHQLGKDCACDEAADGALALDAYRMAKKLESPYDAILLDVQMPVLDGISVLKTIREEEKNTGLSPKETIPIVILTAYEEHRSECKKFQADDFLVKPYNPYILVTTLQRCMDIRK